MYEITHVNLHVVSRSASPPTALLMDRWVSTLTEREPTDRCSPVLDGMTGDMRISAREGMILEGVCSPVCTVTQTERC